MRSHVHASVTSPVDAWIWVRTGHHAMTYGEVEMANSEALNKVLAHITENPGQWQQVRWSTCFAGWTLRLCMPGIEAGKDEYGVSALYQDDSWVPPHDIRDWATSLLGLDSEQAFTLFDVGNGLDDVTRLVGKFTAPAAVPA